ncbi:MULTISPECIES: bifunctional 2-polyprenyl-6-hydroxyphenol methylase/3-demethylubiquinol 3-O-methyltransferase UbiG [Gulbenkiania]|uniref:Ubiquinone biosynthesis O-methyltransferase n=2 Tax=Gulbenkiania TaxID=397456 RepID=A0A0K6H6S1_9NEIS|nr:MULTISPECIES: bifunctional 2-polyprenyl-6-hydroxyphenol methylase/3-demethylubiquinol 3-O-methyltransferase UbiG [Gulbenkiania]TCW33672.1 3-demethylubiquinone-9 3-methyltransferase [Gulbenkiania mobilis]CUA86447.1 3-demethylubiquinone-9 3-methyltransferase [Gulbenkiania indica]
MSNVDATELDKFSQLAHKWWDRNSEFKPLHDINPLRLAYVEEHAGGLTGKKVLDVGCGGGILSESMALRGAQVTGIDLAKKSLKVAQLHSLESGVQVDYRCIAVEALAEEAPAAYDVVTCMEMLEHVPSPESVVHSCMTLVRPGGIVFFSTLNRNLKSYLMAVVGAEYVLGLLPRGTHDYARFLRPSELSRMARNAGLSIVDVRGMHYQPLTRTYALGEGTDVNYLMATRRPG